MLAVVLAAPLLTAPANAQTALPAIEVIATSPLSAGAGPTGGVDRDKVPALTQTLSADDISRTYHTNITDVLFERIPGVSVTDPNGNGTQQGIMYRGFEASPLQGAPQGLAVYMGGVRINEAFGNTVNWDLIPSNAIQRADIWTNNPVFGLNALGGAINLQMKNGFTYQGLEGEMQGGLYGRLSGAFQYGQRWGDRSIYVAGQGLHDDGWRYKSPSDIAKLYFDLGWRNDRTEVHAIVAPAVSSFGVAAATPIQLLDRDYRAIYTTPQTTQNQAALFALNGKHALTDTWSLQGNVYVRRFAQRHVDGNDANIERCSNSASPQYRNHLCLEDDGFPRPNPVTTAFRDQFAILDQNGQPIPCPPGAGNTCATVPYGTVDRTATTATTIGTSLQATGTDKLFGHNNHFVIGGSVDYSWVNFNAASALGFISPDLSITTAAPIPGMGSIITTLGGFGYGPVNIDTRNTYYGLYAVDTFDVTDRLSATFGARLNIARIAVADRLGTSPELNSNQMYTRLNPVAGFTYKIAAGLSVYGGYSESNRIPTPLENGCSNPAKPCLLEGFLVSDPPLKQVVAKTFEVGLRGGGPVSGGKFDWKIGLFRTDSSDDVINLASVIQGRGYFANVPGTRRQGLEASVQYQLGRWLGYAGYNYLDATYRFTGDIASPNNPSADADGNIHVRPGDRIPGIAQHQAKFGLDYLATPDWKIGGGVVAVGERFLTGDDANQTPKLPAYWVANLYTSYQVNKDVQIFARANNVFDRRYALFGTYFEPQAVRNAGLPIALTDQRTFVYGAPLTVYAGWRVKL